MSQQPPTHGSRRARTVLLAAVGLAMVPAAANGFGRFAYGLVLPSMQTALGWSSLVAGAVGAANALGYLVGAVAADRTAARFGEWRTIVGSSILTSLAVLGCAATDAVVVLLVLRLVSGAAAAVAFIAGGAVVARLAAGAAPRQAGRLLGAYFAGPGVGITVSAVLLPPIARPDLWRWSWVLLGALSLLCTLVAVAALRVSDPGAAVHPDERRRAWDRRAVTPLLVSYGLFGAGYIAYMTFVVAYLHREGRTYAQLSLMWVALGTTGVVLAVTLFPALQHLRGGRGVALLTALVTLGSALPLWSSSMGAMVLSASVFGGFLTITAAVTAVARHHLPPAEWPPAIAGLTVAFGIGQSVGPLLSGALSDSASGIRAGLLAGTVLLAAAASVALVQREPASGEPR